MIFPKRGSALAKSLVFEPFDLLARALPQRWEAPQDARGFVPWVLLAHGGCTGLARKLNAAGVDRVGVSEECAEIDLALAKALATGYLAMKRTQTGLGVDWQPGKDWGPLLTANWQEVRKSMEDGDLSAVDRFFREMFRNEAISGLWGGMGMFERFRGADRWMFACRASQFLHHLHWWKQAYGGNLDRIAAAPVGKPWGWMVGDRLVIEPTLEYDGHAQEILRVVADVPNPVVMEIGGGFGGMARQLVRERPDLAYVGVDLPENATLQTCFLTQALPGRKVVLHSEAIPESVEPGSINLFPNFALRNLPKGLADIVVNFRSFAEIHSEGLEAIFAEIARLSPRWIYQENLSAPRQDGLVGITLSQQPVLEAYRTVFETPTPWIRYGAGSAYPCRQKLLERRKAG